jgi:glycosyltransferase involved in cell wall biosynthesis
MRILFYSSIFPRPWNSTRGVYCRHVCRALSELGHQVRVVSPRSWLERPQGGVAVEPSTHAAGSDMNVEYPTYFYPPLALRFAYDQFMWASTRRVTQGVMEEFRPQCLLSYWAHPDGAVAARLARAAGIPSAVIVGGSDVLILGRRGDPMRRRSVVRALHACDAVITVGRQLADAVQALGVPAEKVHVVYQGVDGKLFSHGSRYEARQRLGIPQHEKVLTCVGSLVPVKGIDVLLHAVALVRRAHEHLRLCLVGDGASRGKLKELAASLGVDAVVNFVGAVDQARLPDWYRAADLTILASRSEGVPNVLRESLACGTPFVATRVGGVHELDLGGANRLVPPEDPAALAEAIDAALKVPRRPEGAITFSWAESTRWLLNVLTPLVARAVPSFDSSPEVFAESRCAS